MLMLSAPVNKWVGLYWRDVEEGQRVWIRKLNNGFYPIGPFLVSSVGGRRLQTLDNDRKEFTHVEEDLIRPKELLYERRRTHDLG